MMKMTNLLADAGIRHGKKQRDASIWKVSCRASFSWLVVIAALALLTGSCNNDGQPKNEKKPDPLQRAVVTTAGAKGTAPVFNVDTGVLVVHAVKLTPAKNREAGWGYEIYAKDRLLIRQLQVPAIAGRYGFVSRSDAEKAGNIVLGKIKHHQIPSITLQELNKAGARYRPY